MADVGTGQALLDHLRQTGTGPTKLAKAAALLKDKPAAAAADVVDALRAAGASEGTVQKCEQFLGVNFAATAGGTKTVFPVRAPLGSVTIGGRQFMPGEIVPADLVDAATPDEVRALCKATTAISAQPILPPGEPATANADVGQPAADDQSNPPDAQPDQPARGKRK